MLSSLLRSQYTPRVPDYQFTPYFENQVMRKRPYLSKDMCIRIVRSPIRAELQGNDGYRFFGRVDQLGGRFLRVITLSDKLTILKLNGASGMSEIEGKATRVGASEHGQRTSFNRGLRDCGQIDHESRSLFTSSVSPLPSINNRHSAISFSRH
jgi:hypothetical protein